VPLSAWRRLALAATLILLSGCFRGSGPPSARSRGPAPSCTSRIIVGTLVACTAFRNPGLLSKMAENLDEISAGRSAWEVRNWPRRRSRPGWSTIITIRPPVVIGGGKRSLPDGVRVNLEMVDERRFGNGVVHLHYRSRT